MAAILLYPVIRLTQLIYIMRLKLTSMLSRIPPWKGGNGEAEGGKMKTFLDFFSLCILNLTTILF